MAVILGLLGPLTVEKALWPPPSALQKGNHFSHVVHRPLRRHFPFLGINPASSPEQWQAPRLSSCPGNCAPPVSRQPCALRLPADLSTSVLSNLSFVDICFTSTAVPKMLLHIQTQSKDITYEDCIIQMNFFIIFSGMDNLLLAVMAYDRFVAICHPLHYTVIMNPRLCGLLVLASWVTSVLHSLLQTSMVLQLSFCTEVEIPHFFCEFKQMIQVACSDTFLNNLVMYFEAVLLGGAPLAGILYSDSKIVSTIIGISSAQGKYKTFSTCASHLSLVSLFYCTVLGVYLSSAATQSSHSSAVASVMYTVVTPMLNPFIYSLRNRDIKRALKRIGGFQ
ncbi:olfactory receptor 1571-like [Suricata suricatta]|uniref:olfactory receptor 1571-like n=1 Tax=Suricata suricatta TaxID=37032 RepID=UPI001155949D|nr:olfactory receptor 1571-like [Suricata suricatta]